MLCYAVVVLWSCCAVSVLFYVVLCDVTLKRSADVLCFVGFWLRCAVPLLCCDVVVRCCAVVC